MLECKFSSVGADADGNDRINRYMLECKSEEYKALEQQIAGINRYMLECKFNMNRLSAAFNLELIDTCWNVNSSIDAALA